MRLLILALIQSLLLVVGQVLLKLALARMHPFAFSSEFLKSVLGNWLFALCGLFFCLGSILWFYIIKNFPFSSAYPMVSLSYVLGMIASIFVFHENVDASKWIGVLLIMFGCYLIAK